MFEGRRQRGTVYHGTVALGIHSGGNTGDDACSASVSDNRGYGQPVQEALNARGLYSY